MTVGKIKWYDSFKGYGYILQMDGQEIYFHHTSVAGQHDSLTVGLHVTYDIIQTRMGPEASNVKLSP